MRLTLIAASAALLCLALLSTIDKVQAQPPPQCYWGQPTYSSRVGPYDVSIKIRVHCGGGLIGCKSKLVIKLWVYDPATELWHHWGPDPFETLPRDEMCGGDDLYDYSPQRNLFPAGYLCGVEMQFWTWSQATQSYTQRNSGYTYWNN